MPIVDRSYEVSPLKILRYLLKHMVPIFWGVSIIPFYMAWVFASGKLFPTFILDLLASNPSSSENTAEFTTFLFALLTLGPLLGGSTLLYNDYWDSEVDRGSKRKGLFPLPQGLLSQEAVFRTSIIFMLLAVLFSLLVSPVFALLVGICLVLSLSYSTPPVRIKERAGLDVITNMVGSGLLCSIAGWIIVKSFVDYPFVWGIASMTGVAAIYIPTTIIDHASDKAAGVNTFAVRFGTRTAYLSGVASITIANAVIIYMGLNHYFITPELIMVVWPVALAQVVVYALLLRKMTFKSVYYAILSLCILLVIGNALMLTYYVGYWGLGG
ncbi:MAG: UbiA prenyltransferase family protein [Thermoplasmata archaeon]|nr:MAG: UbiA prenyltransferase family protein [Thermoplasmata archaeon]